MGRFVLRKRAASGGAGAILSSACMDKGKNIWKGTSILGQDTLEKQDALTGQILD